MGRLQLKLLAFRGLLTAFFLISVVGKIMSRNWTVPGSEEDLVGVKPAISELLSRNGFEMIASEGQLEFPSVFARRNECLIQVILAAPQGWQNDVIAQMASADFRVFFVFRGRTYQRQPTWKTAYDHRLRLLRGYFGLTSPAHPVLGVVASHACDLGGIPWQALDGQS